MDPVCGLPQIANQQVEQNRTMRVFRSGARCANDSKHWESAAFSVESKVLAMPCDYRLGFHGTKRRPPVCPNTGEPDPEGDDRRPTTAAAVLGSCARGREVDGTRQGFRA